MELQLNCGNVLPPETAADLLSSALLKKMTKKWNLDILWGVCMLTPIFFIVRHEERTWSLEHSDSILSDSPGMMSSSVGTSKCSSPACMEARARRAAHCGYSDPHRPRLQYGDSFDSLGDSPHSDRWGPDLCGWYGTGFVMNILRSFLSLLVLSQPREASQGTLRDSVETDTQQAWWWNTLR